MAEMGFAHVAAPVAVNVAHGENSWLGTHKQPGGSLPASPARFGGVSCQWEAEPESRPWVCFLGSGCAVAVSMQASRRRRRCCLHSKKRTTLNCIVEAGSQEPLFRGWADWLSDFFGTEFDLVADASAPQELLTASGSRGSAISTRVYTGNGKSNPVRRLRISVVSSGDLEALNAALYPSPDLGDLPILGADVLSLAGGRRFLFGIDWAPASQEPAYHAERIAPFLTEVKRKYAHLLVEPSARFYGEQPEFFSKSIFFSRPNGIDDLQKGSELWSVFEAYCAQYASMLQAATTSDDEALKHRLRQDDYDRWHAERDPAIPVFRKLFGAEWAHRFTEQVLFPGVASVRQ